MQNFSTRNLQIKKILHVYDKCRDRVTLACICIGFFLSSRKNKVHLLCCCCCKINNFCSKRGLLDVALTVTVVWKIWTKICWRWVDHDRKQVLIKFHQSCSLISIWMFTESLTTSIRVISNVSWKWIYFGISLDCQVGGRDRWSLVLHRWSKNGKRNEKENEMKMTSRFQISVAFKNR